MNQQEQKKLENKLKVIFDLYIKKDNKVILGLSGGPDSIFLLNILYKFKIPTIAAHVNHNLRDQESDLDQKFAEDSCKDLDIPFEILSSDILKLSGERKEGVEETGRKERYKFFQKLAKKHKASYIVTAHHADDNTETVILNLIRGSGLEGLSGMKTIENNIFRPLLDVTKQEIIDYLDSKKIPYVNESSNLDRKYRRNFIRHEIIPKFEELNPNLAKTISKNSKIIREVSMYLDQQSDLWIEKNKLNDQYTEYNVKTFTKQSQAIQKIILRKIYKNLISSVQNIESIHLDEVTELINNNIGNKKKKFGKLSITLKANIIYLEKN